MAAVAKLVMEDPHTCAQEVSVRLSFLFGIAQRILHKRLHLQKLAAKRVPHKLKNANMTNLAILSRIDPNM